MRQTYDPGTHLPNCNDCGRPIFVTDAEVVEHDGKRLVELKCVQPDCGTKGEPALYYEIALNIGGAAADEVLCALCEESINESNGAEIESSGVPIVKAWVHHSCKAAWLQAHDSAAIETPAASR